MINHTLKLTNINIKLINSVILEKCLKEKKTFFMKVFEIWSFYHESREGTTESNFPPTMTVDRINKGPLDKCLLFRLFSKIDSILVDIPSVNFDLHSIKTGIITPKILIYHFSAENHPLFISVKLDLDISIFCKVGP